MILVSQTTCTLTGGRDVGPFGEAWLGNADFAQYTYSAKGSASTLLSSSLRNVSPGFAGFDTSFPNTDHKLLRKRLIIGYSYTGRMVNIEAVSLLKDNSQNFLGGNYDDPFATDITISVIGEPLTSDEAKVLTNGLIMDLVQVRQESDQQIPYYQASQFRLPSAIWPLRAGIAVEMKIDFRLWTYFSPDHADKLRDASPLVCKIEFWNEAGQPYESLISEAILNDEGLGYCVISIPAQWCHRMLTFRTNVIKQTHPAPLASDYSGGTIFFN